MPSNLLKPLLYSERHEGGLPDELVLHGGDCCRCGYVFFPMQTYGCERCGAHDEHLAPRELSSRGVLLAYAMVHRHADAARPVPFTIVKIALDEGPVVKSVLSDDGREPKDGQRMLGKLQPAPQGQNQEPLFDLRFAAVDQI